MEPNFLLLRLVLDLNLGFVTGTWVGLETDGLGARLGLGLDWAGLGWKGVGRGQEFCDWNLIF